MQHAAICHWYLLSTRFYSKERYSRYKMSAIINKHKLIWQWSQRIIYLTKCLQQWRTNLTIKTITVVIKTHTVVKIKTNNKTKEREGGKSSGREEKERREIAEIFFCQLHMNYHFLYMTVASAPQLHDNNDSSIKIYGFDWWIHEQWQIYFHLLVVGG